MRRCLLLLLRPFDPWGHVSRMATIGEKFRWEEAAEEIWLRILITEIPLRYFRSLPRTGKRLFEMAREKGLKGIPGQRLRQSI